MAVVRKYDHIMCMSTDSSTKVYITTKQAQKILARGGYREKKKIIEYMEVELNEDTTRNNYISCYWYDDSHIADIGYRIGKGWYIVG